jgi:hypothetical protein
VEEEEEEKRTKNVGCGGGMKGSEERKQRK